MTRLTFMLATVILTIAISAARADEFADYISPDDNFKVFAPANFAMIGNSPTQRTYVGRYGDFNNVAIVVTNRPITDQIAADFFVPASRDPLANVLRMRPVYISSISLSNVPGFQMHAMFEQRVPDRPFINRIKLVHQKTIRRIFEFDKTTYLIAHTYTDDPLRDPNTYNLTDVSGITEAFLNSFRLINGERPKVATDIADGGIASPNVQSEDANIMEMVNGWRGFDIQGTWMFPPDVTKRKAKDDPESPYNYVEYMHEQQRETFEFSSAGNRTECLLPGQKTASYELVQNSSPTALKIVLNGDPMTFTGSKEASQTLYGIYRIENDAMTLVLSTEETPTSFEQEVSGSKIFRLRRPYFAVLASENDPQEYFKQKALKGK